MMNLFGTNLDVNLSSWPPMLLPVLLPMSLFNARVLNLILLLTTMLIV